MAWISFNNKQPEYIFLDIKSFTNIVFSHEGVCLCLISLHILCFYDGFLDI